jgi:hypothetical protein
VDDIDSCEGGSPASPIVPYSVGAATGTSRVTATVACFDTCGDGGDDGDGRGKGGDGGDGGDGLLDVFSLRVRPSSRYFDDPESIPEESSEPTGIEEVPPPLPRSQPRQFPAACESADLARLPGGLCALRN